MTTKGQKGKKQRKGKQAEQSNRRSPRQANESNRTSLLLFGGAGILIVAIVIFGVIAAAGDAERVDQLLINLYQGQETLGVTGDDIKFEDILAQGKPTVLNFWGGDCPPCRAEMPDLQRSYARNGENATFFGLDSGRFLGLGTTRSGRSLIDELFVTYPAGDPPDRSLLQRYQIQGLPATMFIRSDGTLFRRWDGIINENQLDIVIGEMVRAEAEGAS